MNDYEKASLLYLAHIAGLLHAIASTEPHIADWIGRMESELRRDLRNKVSTETLRLLGDK